MSQHVNLEESSYAMSQIFPPEQFLGNAQKVLLEAQALKNQGFNQEMENLVNKFAGPGSQKHVGKHSDQQLNRKKS